MYLNLPLMLTLFYGGYQMIIIDILHIVLMSLLNENIRAQSHGNSLIEATLKKIEKNTADRQRKNRIENGKIVQKYINYRTSKFAYQEN
jgi:hypothetical protein